MQVLLDNCRALWCVSLVCQDTVEWCDGLNLNIIYMNSNMYRVSLKSFSGHVGTLRCTSEEFQPWIMFQQDGAPPHWSSHVRRFLDAAFPNRWIGRDGPTLWPPRSPHINPLDFFLWGYVKDKVFSTPVPDITNLKGKNSRRFYYNN